MIKINEGFFVLNKQKFVKDEDEKNRKKIVDDKDFVKAKEVKYIISDRHILIDADSEESVKKIESLIALLPLQPYSYITKEDEKGRHKHYWFEVSQDARFLINKYKLNSSAHQLIFHNDIDTRAFNVLSGATGAVYLKMNDKQKSGRPSPIELLEKINKKLPEIPLLLLLHVKVGKIPKSGNNWSNKALSTIMRMKKDKWAFDLGEKMFASWASYYGDDHDINEIKHKWEDAYEMKSDYEKNWTSGFLWPPQRAKGKNEDDEEYEKIKNNHVFLATDVKDFEKISKHLIKENNLFISKEDDRIWGLNDYKELEPIQDIRKYINRVLIKGVGNIKPSAMGQVGTYMTGSVPYKKIELNPFIVSFKNKSVNVLTGEEYNIPKGFVNTNIIPWNFVNISKDNEKFKKEKEFLKESMLMWANGDKEVVKELYELIGLAMTKHMGTEKVYFLLGNGSNGKSWFLTFLIKILGQWNVSNEDLKSLSKDEFSSSQLYGKIANINLDISSSVIEDTSLFKKIASGDRMSAAFKGKDKFSFNPYALNIFGANAIPYTIEFGDSDAINRRLKIITFNKKIDKTTTTELERSEMKDMLMSEKLIQVAIYESLKAVKKALEKGFSNSKNSKQTLQEHKEEMNPLYHFLEECPIKDGEPIIKGHKRYEAWALQYGFKTISLNNFVKKYINVARGYGIIVTREKIGKNGAERHKFIVEEMDEEQYETR